jgi:hypothetical protein
LPIQAALQICGLILRNLASAYARGHINTRTMLGALTATGTVVAIGVATLGAEETLEHLNLSGDRDSRRYREVIKTMDPNEQAAALQSLKEVQEDVQKMGKVQVLAGTEVPPYWESEQKSAKTVGTSEWECVPVAEGTLEWDSE